VLALVLVTAGAWQLVDGGLERWVVWLAAWAAQWQPRAGELRPLAPLNTLGPADAPVQLVLACDVAEPGCRQRLGVLVAWQAQHDDEARLILLQRPSDPHRPVAESLQAAARQGLLWRVLSRCQARPELLEVAAVGDVVRTVDGHPVRWRRDLAEAEVALQVGTERTMAAALGLTADAPVLLSGVPLSAADLGSSAATTAALDREWLKLKQRVAHHRGKVGAAQLELLHGLAPATRQRYVAWILHSERAPSLRLARSPTDPQR
jgi:hypothetical protein